MNKMESRIKRGVLFIPIFIGGMALFTLIVMLLWNAVLPTAIAGVNTITYWQALGILVLSKILFGFGGGWGGSRRRWKNRNMTPEEKEKFRAEWRDRCGGRWKSNNDTAAATGAD